MNLVIGGVVGGLIALMGVIGGTQAYIGSPEQVADESLYTYADN